jgi:hypothetical protein
MPWEKSSSIPIPMRIRRFFSLGEPPGGEEDE